MGGVGKAVGEDSPKPSGKFNNGYLKSLLYRDKPQSDRV